MSACRHCHWRGKSQPATFLLGRLLSGHAERTRQKGGWKAPQARCCTVWWQCTIALATNARFRALENGWQQELTFNWVDSQTSSWGGGAHTYVRSACCSNGEGRGLIELEFGSLLQFGTSQSAFLALWHKNEHSLSLHCYLSRFIYSAVSISPLNTLS